MFYLQATNSGNKMLINNVADIVKINFSVTKLQKNSKIAWNCSGLLHKIMPVSIPKNICQLTMVKLSNFYTESNLKGTNGVM